MAKKQKVTNGLGNSIVSRELNNKHLEAILKTKIEKLSLAPLNDLIEKLNAYRYIFSNINPSQLIKNGFTTNHIMVYKPVLEKVLFNAMNLKSERLDAEQLPGQVSLFGLGRVFDEARKNHSYSKDNSTYIRQSENTVKATRLDGKDCDISFALNKVIKGWYCLIEADVLQPSHIGNMQNPLHFIPEAQPRNRATSASGHNTPKLIAENLRPAEIVEGATAYAGAPIINMRGEVIQGNGRAFTIKYYYNNFPNDPAHYISWLKKNTACYDLESGIESMKNPVMVRMVRLADEQAIELGQYTQKDLEAVANETTQIKSKVGLLNDEALDHILNELLSRDTGEQTLGELIRESNVLKSLIKEQILRGDDLEVYTRNGVINETGVNFVTKFLLNLIFKDGDVNTSDIFIQLPVSLQKAIEKSALYILKCRGEQNINTEISKCILGLREYLAFKGSGNINEWKNQQDIFGGSVAEKFNDFEFKLISIFADSTTQKQIIDYFKQYSFYATVKPGDMFEEERAALSKKEAVKTVFNAEINTPVVTSINPKSKAIAIAKAKAKALLIQKNK